MIVKESDWNDLEEYRNHLEHHGVKGMRWGHRKEKPSSGSTKKKKKKTMSQKLRAIREARAKKRVAKAKARAEKLSAKKEAQRKKILSNPTSLYKHRKEFSYEEINDALKRFEWEEKLQNYSKNRLKNGADYIQSMTNTAINTINLYNQAARVVNSLSNTDNERDLMPYIKNADLQKKKSDDKDDKNKTNKK